MPQATGSLTTGVMASSDGETVTNTSTFDSRLTLGFGTTNIAGGSITPQLLDTYAFNGISYTLRIGDAEVTITLEDGQTLAAAIVADTASLAAERGVLLTVVGGQVEIIALDGATIIPEIELLATAGSSNLPVAGAIDLERAAFELRSSGWHDTIMASQWVVTLPVRFGDSLLGDALSGNFQIAGWNDGQAVLVLNSDQFTGAEDVSAVFSDIILDTLNLSSETPAMQEWMALPGEQAGLLSWLAGSNGVAPQTHPVGTVGLSLLGLVRFEENIRQAQR